MLDGLRNSITSIWRDIHICLEGVVLHILRFTGYSLEVASICVPKKLIVTGDYYAEESLSEVQNHYFNRRSSRGAKGIRLLHDNARPHKAKLVRELFSSMVMIGLTHLPYSSVLYHVPFGCLILWKSTWLASLLIPDCLLDMTSWGAIVDTTRGVRKDIFKQIERLKLCLSHKGKYFEQKIYFVWFKYIYLEFEHRAWNILNALICWVPSGCIWFNWF